MNIGQSNVHCVFRDIGNSGLVIFERDGLLLTKKQPNADLMLSDVNEELIETLRWLRHLGARFGFVSVNPGGGTGNGDPLSWQKAMTVIDALLDIRDAKPDFWIFGGSRDQENHSIPRLYEDCVKLVSRVLEWYDVHPSQALIVSTLSTAQSGEGPISIRGIQMGRAQVERRRLTIELTDAEPITFATLQTNIRRLSHFAQ